MSQAPPIDTPTGGFRSATARARRCCSSSCTTSSWSGPWCAPPRTGPRRLAAPRGRRRAWLWRVLSRLGVPLPAAQRPLDVVAALGQQPAQRRRAGPADVIGGSIDAFLSDQVRRVADQGEVLRHVRAPVAPDVGDNLEEPGRERRQQLFLVG